MNVRCVDDVRGAWGERDSAEDRGTVSTNRSAHPTHTLPSAQDFELGDVLASVLSQGDDSAFEDIGRFGKALSWISLAAAARARGLG